MDFSHLLKRNFTVLREEEWREHPYLSQCLESGIVLLRDGAHRVVGALTKGNPAQPEPVGMTSIETLRRQAARFGTTMPGNGLPGGEPRGSARLPAGPQGDGEGSSGFAEPDLAEPDWEAYALWVITDEQGNIIGWTDREALCRLWYRMCRQRLAFYEAIFASLPHQVTVIDKEGRVLLVNERALQGLGLREDQVVGRKMGEIFRDASLEAMLACEEKKTVVKVTEDKQGILTQTNIWQRDGTAGAIQVCWDAKEIDKIAMNLESYSNLAMDLKAVFDSSYDVIYVSDGRGITLRVSSACERLWGYKAEELIGKSVYQLEQEGVYKPSITRLVMERKEKVQALQITKTGRRLMVVGTPIKDEKGNIVRVINTSRDITEQSRLELELEDTRALMEGYKRELEQLRRYTMKQDSFLFQSEKMQNVVTLAGKVAEVDSTVLILGESGVGKEVIASYIHQHSRRRDKPFIKVNCGAIPESLLESELFGYEKGAFTGAAKEGKLGLFELANEGTLFLDEIGEMSLPLQVKLLRVLQENELVRLGGTKPVKINVRIIAATNRNLEEETKKGNFREDLYYRLNVVPISVPPLRERKEDILPLTFHFIAKFNEKYKKNKTFSPEALKCFQDYHWPGNVRELQNIVERLIVITDQDMIESHHLPEGMRNAPHSWSGVRVAEIMPLKEAVESVEKQLLTLAKEKYGTTTKMAEALGVDQSTISRKLAKFRSS
ncbi:hypothetical protein BSNK01_02880 [Bacillaceae bacterium]